MINSDYILIKPVTHKGNYVVFCPDSYRDAGCEFYCFKKLYRIIRGVTK